MMSFLVVAVGGAIGSVGRYTINLLMHMKEGWNFPFATLLVNIVGCFFIGWLAIYFTQHGDINDRWRLFLMVGVLGGFTTFSSFSLETMNFIAHREYYEAGVNVLLNVILSMGATFLGVWMAK